MTEQAPDTDRQPSVWDGSELPPTARLIVDMSDRVFSMSERVNAFESALGETRDTARNTEHAVHILLSGLQRISRTLDDVALALGAVARAVGVDLPPPLRIVGGTHGGE